MKIKLFNYLGIVFLGLVLITSCSKDKEVTPSDEDKGSQITGSYFITTGLSGKYAFLSEDTLYSYGSIKELDRRIPAEGHNYGLKGDTILLDETKYLFSKDGNTLTLSPLSSDQKIILVEGSDSEIPDLQDWVLKAEVKEVMEFYAFDGYTSKIQSFALRRGYLYTNGYANDHGDYVLGKIDLTDYTMEEFPIPASSKTTLGYERYISYINNTFWVEIRDMSGSAPYYDDIIQFDVETLESVDSIELEQYFGSVYDIVSSPNESAIYAQFYEGIRKFNPLNKKYESLNENIGDAASGNSIALSNTSMYEISGRGQIYKFLLSNLSKAMVTYQVNTEITYELIGAYSYSDKIIYAIAGNRDTSMFVLLKITLPF